MGAIERDPSRLFAPPSVRIARREEGSIILRSGYELEPYDRCVGEWLQHWGAETPRHPFLLERGADGGWAGVTYAEALERVERVGSWLLSREIPTGQPVAILSENSVEHGLLSLAALHVGIPVVPVSPSYSLMSKDFGKLNAIFAQVRPAAVYVADYERFAPALGAIRELHQGVIIVGSGKPVPKGAVSFGELMSAQPDAVGLQRAFAGITPETIAKVLFTSGSTGEPKGVITTQRMLCSNQQGMLQLWPFLRDAPPVVVDWLPWNHTFGGSLNFNLVLRHGGTLYVDGGRPVPALFDLTVKNLREVAPTVYFNVPRAYDLLVAALTADEALCANFFSRLQVIVYAAAALPQKVWEQLTALARRTVGGPIVLTSGWGSTETAPAATFCHLAAERSGNIGAPLPGCELKLCSSGHKLEVRVRGPNVTPGYSGQPELTRKAFDEEGFYKIGDAVRFVDEAHPEKGLYFDGRVLEDFKLTTGTWVSVGALRVAGIDALAPIAQDIVVTGQDRDYVGFLIFPNISACRTMCADLASDAPIEQVLSHPAVVRQVRVGLQKLRSWGTSSSTSADRAVLLAEPASIDSGEITDKGYINQRAVLARRGDLVLALHGAELDARVISCS